MGSAIGPEKVSPHWHSMLLEQTPELMDAVKPTPRPSGHVPLSSYMSLGGTQATGNLGTGPLR